jgi:hypothetical protein
MASNFKISTAARNAAANAIGALCNGGTIQIRTGAPPANVSDADSGTLLGAPGFGGTAFGSAANGTAAANAISSATAAASGDAGHFRAKDGSSNTVFQGTAGNAADSADMTFDNKSIVAGGTIAISSLTLTVPIQ